MLVTAKNMMRGGGRRSRSGREGGEGDKRGMGERGRRERRRQQRCTRKREPLSRPPRPLFTTAFSPSPFLHRLLAYSRPPREGSTRRGARARRPCAKPRTGSLRRRALWRCASLNLAKSSSLPVDLPARLRSCLFGLRDHAGVRRDPVWDIRRVYKTSRLNSWPSCTFGCL